MNESDIERRWWKESVVYQIYSRSFNDTDGGSWIPVNPDKETANAEAARADPDSVRHYYRDLIALRSDDRVGDLLVYGEYDQLTPEHESLWAYTRTFEGDRLLVVLNVADEPTAIDIPTADIDVGIDTGASADLLLANYDAEAERPVSAVLDDTLRPWEARVYRVA